MVTVLQQQLSVVFTCDSSHCSVACLRHRNSVCLSITEVDQSKTVQARITKSSPSAALVSGFESFYLNSKGVTRVRALNDGVGKICDF